ncbi:hypothetical protein BGZ49_003204, partial [Haplosporangium sp. Z 27]
MDTSKPSQLSILPALLDTIPSLDGKHFFISPPDLSDDCILDEIDIFPMNPNQQYQAPTPDFYWPQGSEIHQGFDRNLARIQERQAHTTRPLDELAVDFSNMDPELPMNFPYFIHHIRSQLTITARLVQEMRMENNANALGANPEIISNNEILVARHEVVAEIEAIDGLPSASTSISRVNPLDILEIQFEVGQYLDKPDWLICSLVCKDWNQTFTKLLYSDIRISEPRKPSLEVLQSKGELIRSFSISPDDFDISLCILVLPNLRFLGFTLDDSNIMASFGLARLMGHSKQITELSISVIAKHDNRAFWEAVSDLPLLGKIEILEYKVIHQGSTNKALDLTIELLGFWSSCSRLKKLKIRYFKYFPNSYRREEIDWNKAGFRKVGILEENTFPHLRHLEIYCYKTDVISQTMLITRCPNLKSLEWSLAYPGVYDMVRPTRALCQYFEEGNLTNLKSLTLPMLPGQDTLFADILRSLDGRPLEKLDLSGTDIGDIAYEELQRFYPTLRTLDLSSCKNFSSTNSLDIHVSCPHLEDVKVYRIHAEGLDLKKDWSCHQTLHSLSISFELEPRVGSNGTPAGPEATHQALCETIYSTLAQLYEIRELSIDFRFEGRKVSIPLEVRLSKGLWKLAGLKKLRSFRMDQLSSSITSREVYWMIAHWPNLVCVMHLPATISKKL